MNSLKLERYLEKLPSQFRETSLTSSLRESLQGNQTLLMDLALLESDPDNSPRFLRLLEHLQQNQWEVPGND
jgi:hypothetical protein